MALSPSLPSELHAVGGATVELNVPLAPLTTIRSGGRGAVVVTSEDTPAVVDVLRILEAGAVPWYCLGAGSDLLVADEGYEGVIVRLGEGYRYVDGLRAAPGSEKAVVTVGAGTLLARFAEAAARAGLAGVEFACGIPGSVGGGVATNAGAYGRCLADVLLEVQLATAKGARWVRASELDWEYRHCRLPVGAVVAAVRFGLDRDEPERIIERQCSILEMRRAVQPQGVLTFGSSFKNPSGGAAGRLLEAAGVKGERRGGAEVSRAHANFVVNLGDATTADVLALLTHMRDRVHETSGVWLEPEVRLLGTSFPWESPVVGSARLPAADG